MQSVGIVGVGVMGSAMAGHLLDAGFDVVGYDVEPARLDELTRRGGRAAGSCQQVVGEVGLLITSLPSASAFEQVVGHIADAARAGTARAGLAVADTSTLPPELKGWGRATLAAHRVTLLDCPLSGTGQQARSRDLVVYASGDRAAVDGFGPVFEAFARAWHNVGDFGAGSKLKLVANLLVAVHNVAAAEALVLARKAGLDPGMVLELVGNGAGSSRMFEVRGPLMASGNYDDVGMRTQAFQKDVEIIAAFARAHGCAVPTFATASQLYSAAVGQGHGDHDTACVYEILAGMAGLARDESAEQGDGAADQGSAGQASAGRGPAAEHMKPTVT